MTNNLKITKVTIRRIARDLVEEGRAMEAIKLLTDAHDGKRYYNLESALVECAPFPTANVGDIMYTSWGYDQTNVDFYQVVRVRGRSVYVCEIGARYVSADRVVAVPDVRWGAETRHTIGKHYTGVGYTLTIDGYRTAWLWDGEPKYVTPSGYGH